NQTWVLHDPLVATVNGWHASRDVGQSLAYAVRVVGGIEPYSISVSGLPAGCEPPGNVTSSFVIDCHLASTGTFVLNLSASDRPGVHLSLFAPLQVNPDPFVLTVINPNPSTVGVPISLQGTPAEGTPPYLLNWTVEGQPPSNLSVEFVTFSAPGTYSANFSVTDGAGWTVYRTTELVIHRALVVTLTLGRNRTDAGLPVRFAAVASGGTAPLSYAWQFGDGTTAFTNQTTHAFAKARVYQVEVWANDSVGAGATAIANITVNPPLSVNATENATSATLYEPVSFVSVTAGGTPPYRYWWNFGDDGSSYADAATYAFTTLGNHSVTLVVNDSVGGSRTVNLTVDVTSGSTSSPPPHVTSRSGGASAWEYLLAAAAVVVVVAVVGVVLLRRRNSPPPFDGSPPPQ
ncbi:thermopsin, partial [mine drainage metagenome]